MVNRLLTWVAISDSQLLCVASAKLCLLRPRRPANLLIGYETLNGDVWLSALMGNCTYSSVFFLFCFLLSFDLILHARCETVRGKIILFHVSVLRFVL